MGRPAKLSGSGGQILVQSLLTQGADQVFCVPGESHLAVLDALYDARDRIKLVVCRQEGGASNMADACGKLTGRPGLALVTRGPGACNASIGIHTASQDSTPLILLVGQVPRTFMDREAFQEIDYRRMFGQMAKWVAQIDEPRRVPEYVSRAFHTAISGRPGPVVLALPEDMLTQQAEAPAAPRARRTAAAPAPEQVGRLRALLERAHRPIAILGGTGWTGEACENFRRFAEGWQLPVTCAFRYQDLFDNDHPLYAADLAINSGMPELAASLADLQPGAKPGWTAETASARAEYVSWNAPVHVQGPLQMAEVVHHLRERLPEDAIVANGAGNFSSWVHRFHCYRRFRSQLGPTSGAMGYGVPAAVAAKSVYPERTVIAFSGDGDFLMTGQELATAVQYGLPVILIVVNNGSYGTIRMHQERKYPGRVHGTHLQNPDFAAYARAFGAFGETVETTEQFAPAFERALAANVPALLELRLSEEVITPTTTLSAIRERALQQRGIAQRSGDEHA